MLLPFSPAKPSPFGDLFSACEFCLRPLALGDVLQQLMQVDQLTRSVAYRRSDSQDDGARRNCGRRYSREQCSNARDARRAFS